MQQALSGFPRPLAGKTVIDLSLLFPGPYCAAQLAAFGARIIKIEPVGKGDPMRDFSSGMFEEINRNKESVAINLKTEAGRFLLKDMAAKADALIDGFRPGVMARLGLGYETLKELNAALVYCAVSGFGLDGPYRDKPGHDLGFLALAGYYSVPSQIDNLKSRPNVRLADIIGGQIAAYATSMALWEAQASGRGRLVDVSMFDSVASMVLPMMFASPGVETGDVQHMPHVMADSDLYETADGRFLALTTFEDKLWQRFADAVATQCPALADPRFATREGRNLAKHELSGLLKPLFKTKTLAQWTDILEAADTGWSPVYERDELLSDPHFQARGFVAHTPHRSGDGGPIRYSLFPAKFDGAHEAIPARAPRLGAHTEAVLLELGRSRAEVDALLCDGVVQGAAAARKEDAGATDPGRSPELSATRNRHL